MRRYNILLAQPKTASAPLVAAAKSVWLWTSLLAGGQPLSEGELQQLVSKNNTSSPGTTQIPVSGAAQMKEPVDSCSEKPNVANQKSPSTARHRRRGAKTTRRNPCQMNESNTASTPLDPIRSNFGHPVNASPQRRNPELKHDPKSKPDSKNKKELKGENSKGKRNRDKSKQEGTRRQNTRKGKGSGPSQCKNKPDGENSKRSCEGKGQELKHDPQKKNQKKRRRKKKKPEGENSEGSCEGKGSEIEHDPQKKPDK
uniref:Uncharacterized protein n=1 Tax=Salix viminalis TaxID=40686 RepID=A0A6N2KE58_SALVM